MTPHGKDPHLESFVKNCNLWEESTSEKFMEDSQSRVGPNAGAGKNHEEEGVKLSSRRWERWQEGDLRLVLISHSYCDWISNKSI